jgi:sorbitol/mannitol transport system permease protein
MASVIAIVSWQWIPFVMLILLAGLQSLPDSTVEAARIDGASGFGMFRHIIFPHLTRFVEIARLLETIFILSEFRHYFRYYRRRAGIQTTNLPYQIFLEAFSAQNVGAGERLRHLRRDLGEHRHVLFVARASPQFQHKRVTL